MVNAFLIVGICCFFLYAFYDQFLMDYLKGTTKLKVRLKKRAKIDALIFIVLVTIILYQSSGQINTTTLYLLAMTILLSLYIAFIRFPVLLLKEQGFFFENIYIDYAKIRQINLLENNTLIIELKNKKHLMISPENLQDIEKIVHFFGGYKSLSNKRTAK
ncbi:hypothetical protein BTV20_07105 [Histophilus somni]|uniref:UPF0266 membrane protein JFL49_07095 n=1 Tax=Histophilus somni TaxID=731 RepID=A0A9Q6YZW1_HISSO|nr:DUF986 family protein [Histophilus somni]ARU65213.1 hypothetical protein BTV18_06670 [Histophilus somni]ARU67077.1 hypothetical protein BTV19_07095 [Histophilus somni]ARU68954.1 hypothetical protein BTV16_07110 [Histophilus somni]ARU70833.1 hypothetical protein BTV20_07105 [Histophilus somni]ARU72705.1 hypothetical protein BTV17_07090 [Histophilus somni]